VRVLGIDVGEKRYGISISDALKITAQNLKTIEYRDKKSLFVELKNIINSENVGEVVIGLPLNMNGTHGDAAKKAIGFADELKAQIDIPIVMWDERLSTKQAERMMISFNTSRGKRKKKIDGIASQIFLQSYLNTKGNKINEV